MGKKLEISFLCHPDFKDVFDPPVPASKILPDYYKEMPTSTSSTGRPVFNDQGDPGQTMKKCMPVIDSMTAGYFITLVTDVYVENQGDFGKNFVWPADGFSAISSHPDGQFPGLPISDEYDSISAYKFANPWQIVTPKGHSCLFVHPMWHYDLPFHTFPGVVDTDAHPVPVNFPFIIKKDFEGYIRKGTPIVQVIPFKREEFQSSVGIRKPDQDKIWNKAKLQFSNRYKEHFRSPKSFR